MTDRTPSDLPPQPADDLPRLVHEALGAASMCWENPEKAGVFQSSKASGIAWQLIRDIRASRAGNSDQKDASRYRWLCSQPDVQGLAEWLAEKEIQTMAAMGAAIDAAMAAPTTPPHRTKPRSRAMTELSDSLHRLREALDVGRKAVIENAMWARDRACSQDEESRIEQDKKTRLVQIDAALTALSAGGMPQRQVVAALTNLKVDATRPLASGYNTGFAEGWNGALDAALTALAAGGEPQPVAEGRTNDVLVSLIRPEGYEDVHDDYVLEDAHINPAFEPMVVYRATPQGHDPWKRAEQRLANAGHVAQWQAQALTDEQLMELYRSHLVVNGSHSWINDPVGFCRSLLAASAAPKGDA